MNIYPLFLNGILCASSEDLYVGESISSLDGIVRDICAAHPYLTELSVDDLITFFSLAADQWSRRDGDLIRRYGQEGMAFLNFWLRESNIRTILDVSLRGNRHVLDDFSQVPQVPYFLFARPRGIVCHWLSGNVPILGMLSLIQGVLTKNTNIVKVAYSTGLFIPRMLDAIRTISFRGSSGKMVSGKQIAETIAVVYVDSEDRDARDALSSLANVRIAWGSADAVRAIIGSPRNIDCEDIIFGPRVSLAVIGREFLSSEKEARSAAAKIARDASFFEQKGCNSPHTIFVEKGETVAPRHFAEILAEEMERVSRAHPLRTLEPGDTSRILTLRAKYDIIGTAHYPHNLQWSVFFSERDCGLCDPCAYRTLFVQPVSDSKDIIPFLSSRTQSIGVALSPERKKAFVRAAFQKGADRCPDIGTMAAYDTPWDGMFVLDRLVRWGRLSL